MDEPGIRINQGLWAEQRQQLIMTPQMRQAIEILQLSAVELVQLVRRELLENPILELNEEDGDLWGSGGEPSERQEGVSLEWIEYFEDSSDIGYVSEEKEAKSIIDNVGFDSPSLQEHLSRQLNLLSLDPHRKAVAEFLTGNLDGNGYLTLSVEEAAELLGTGPGQVEEALKVVQSLDPPGVGARNLRECLLLQLGAMEGTCVTELAARIVEGFLEDVARGRIVRIAAQLKVPPAKVQEAVDLIKGLDPRPGCSFGRPEIRYVVPDIVVEKVEGDYVIVMNDSYLPKLRISPVYRRLLREGRASLEENTKRFISEKMQSAVWLMRNIEQRRRTMYSVMEYIVQRQREFLDKGIHYLKPMTLRDVASAIGVHESTVSRATANKWVQTPRGMFELRFFFAGGLGVTGTDERSVSSTSVKQMVEEIVSGEDPKKPFTDQDISDLLRKRGIEVSRRTVSKYREELGILSSGKRRRY